MKKQIYDKPIMIRIPKEQKDKIARIAEKQMRTEASVIREAIQFYLMTKKGASDD